MTEATPNIPSQSGSGAKREPPSADMVDAAEFDYQRTRDTYAELVAAVRGMLADGFTDFEAVADVWRTLRTQEERRQHFLLAAIAVVQIAKSPQPPPPLGEPGNTPN